MEQTLKDKRTTVKELIKALQKLPPDLCVFTSGYEGGYEDAIIPTLDKFNEYAINVNTAWYYGPHEGWDASHEGNKVKVRAIVL